MFIPNFVFLVRNFGKEYQILFFLSKIFQKQCWNLFFLSKIFRNNTKFCYSCHKFSNQYQILSNFFKKNYRNFAFFLQKIFKGNTNFVFLVQIAAKTISRFVFFIQNNWNSLKNPTEVSLLWFWHRSIFDLLSNTWNNWKNTRRW